MKHRKIITKLCSILLVLCVLPVIPVTAADKPPSQAGPRKLEGAQRDFLWPVPGEYNLSSCYLDNRDHRSLDIAALMGQKVVASYDGKVIEIFTSCKHNWGKKGSCCSSWGNYVLLEHSYKLKNGQYITLYSRYAHLTKASVKVGQSVAKGEQVGTIGSTGSSTGPHLDYDILWGGTSKKYSLDPYINDLLELPDELYTTFGKCCQDYVAYVKKYYPRCAHSAFTEKGACTECGYVFDWKTTRDIDAMGNYKAPARTTIFELPYIQSEGTILQAEEIVSVNATLVNGLGQHWYEVSLKDGKVGYVLEAALTFHSYFASEISGTLTTLQNGQKLAQVSHRLDGTITSRYPLRKIVGYLDAEQYATWSSTGSVRDVSLRGTKLNKNLSFAKMAPGEHTLTITAQDSTGRDAVQVLTCKFTIEKTAATCTVTFEMETENVVLTLKGGEPIGELPELAQDGQHFLGWFSESGEQVTSETIPTENITLTPKWEPIVYTVTMEDQVVEFPFGSTLDEDTIPVREGYDFEAWLAEDGRQITFGDEIIRDMKLVAKWNPKSFAVQLDVAGGTLDTDATLSVIYDAKYGTLPIPTREGHTFVGWKLGEEMITADTVFRHTQPVTLTAVWEKETNFNALWLLLLIPVAGAGVFFWLRKRQRESITV